MAKLFAVLLRFVSFPLLENRASLSCAKVFTMCVFLEKTQKPVETSSEMNMSQLIQGKSARPPSVEQASIHCDKARVILESQRAFPAVTWLTVDRGPAC